MESNTQKYSRISKQRRQEIIDKIVTEKQPLAEVVYDVYIYVAASFQLLPSTCKSIVNTYIKEGRVGKKESRIRKVKKIVTTYHIVLNPMNPLFSAVQVQKVLEHCEEPSMKSQQDMEVPPKAQQQSFEQFLANWCRSMQ